MMTIKPLDGSLVNALQNQFTIDDDTDALVSKASQIISQLTQFAGVVMLPKGRSGIFKQIEFLNLGQDRILAILVTQEGKVQNRVIRVERPFTESELTEATNYFNDCYSGRPMDEVRQVLLRDMRRDSDEISRIMHTVSVVGGKVFDDSREHGDMLVSGEERLLDIPDLAELEKLRRLFDTFKTKHDLVELLDKSVKADGVSIFIGDESGYQALNDVSVVVSPYESDGRVLGVLGVIGPTRMAYDEVIPMVDITAKLLGSALTSKRD